MRQIISKTWHKNKKAFTLVEVLIGITILTIVFLALSSLFVASIRANSTNLHTLTGYTLSQEGIELVRNARDSNWIQNYAFLGTNGFTAPLNVSDLNVGESAYYIASISFDSNNTGIKMAPLDVKENISEDKEFYVFEQKAKFIQLCAIPQAKVGTYLANNFDGADTCEKYKALSTDSQFSRFIRIERLSLDKIEVKSVVTWRELWNTKNKPSRVELTTYLTNWKKGKL